MPSLPSIVVAAEDYARLTRLTQHAQPGTVAAQLEAELERADVRPLDKVPPHVVVMHSAVAYEEVTLNQVRRVRLVFPTEVRVGGDTVSVLAPLGCALLGLRVGQEIDWAMPGGPRRLRVLAVTRQAIPPSV